MASDSSSSKWVMENGDIPHVLAVDDNIIDRTLVEKLLKNSSCKGTYTYLSLNHFLLYSFSLFQTNYFYTTRISSLLIYTHAFDV
jgi:hypothetical protein